MNFSLIFSHPFNCVSLLLLAVDSILGQVLLLLQLPGDGMCRLVPTTNWGLKPKKMQAPLLPKKIAHRPTDLESVRASLAHPPHEELQWSAYQARLARVSSHKLALVLLIPCSLLPPWRCCSPTNIPYGPPWQFYLQRITYVHSEVFSSQPEPNSKSLGTTPSAPQQRQMPLALATQPLNLDIRGEVGSPIRRSTSTISRLSISIYLPITYNIMPL